MLDDTVDLLTKQMLKDTFKDKKNDVQATITMTKTQLYQFCIKLVKLIKEVEQS